jgi:hypothetical protein
MTPERAASASAAAIGGVPSHFMLDPATYATGAELGFPGMSFYVGGRGGALGDVSAEVVTAAFVFFHPDNVADGWAQSAGAMGRIEAAEAFAACSHRWARQYLAGDLDVGRLAELAGKVTAAASPAGAPLFAAWRALPEPDDAPALALHRMNVLRELRGGLHGCAVLASGLAPEDALAVRTPFMAALFGWPEPGDASVHQSAWDQAEAATDVAMARVLSVLSEAERAEFVALCGDAIAATT